MATVFTKIIDGDIPGHFVYKDDVCVGFLSIEPVTRGHTLLVPREEVDSYWDAKPETVAHMAKVAQLLSKALLKAYPNASRVGQIVAGFDVPHLHVHLIALESQDQLTLAGTSMAEQDDLAAEAAKVRAAVEELS